MLTTKMKNFQKLKFISFFSVMIVIYIGIVIMIESDDYITQVGSNYKIVWFTPSFEYIKHFSVALFLYNNTPTIINVFAVTTDKSKKYLSRITIIGCGLCMVFYMLVGVFGLISLADETPEIF